MLDLQRPETQLARRLRPTGGHGSARGSLGPKRGVGAASGRVSCAAHTKRSQMSEAARRFLRLFRLITSRVLVESACPSGGGRGQLKRSPFPSFMRLRDPQAQREQKGTFVFTNSLVFTMQIYCYRIKAHNLKSPIPSASKKQVRHTPFSSQLVVLRRSTTDVRVP